MEVAQSSENRIILVSDTRKAVISKMLGGEKPTTGCCRLMRRKTSLAVVVTSFQNPKASRMAQLLCKMNFLRAKGTEVSDNAQGKGEKVSKKV